MFSGGTNSDYRRFGELNDAEIDLVKSTLSFFPRLSREEIALTICENLSWYTPSGGYKRDACLSALRRLEKRGIVNLPKSRCDIARPQKIKLSERTDEPLVAITKKLSDVKPITLLPADSPEEKQLWNEYVERHHPLGYKRPFGVHQRYFIVGGGQYLGCFLVSGAAKSLAVRDRWLGWSLAERRMNLHRIINNSRFLLFPWTQVKYLASHVLALAVRTIPRQWEIRWGYCPVLMETFVDPAYFSGSCYRASNWQYLGETRGTGRPIKGKSYLTTRKSVFVRPLIKNFVSTLRRLQ